MTSSKSFLYAFCLIVALAGVVVLAQAPKHKPPPPPPTTTRNSSVATTGPAGNATHRHHHGNGSLPHPHQHTGNATHRHHHGGNASHPHPHPHQHHANKTHLKISHCDKSIKNIATINSVEIKDCKGPACTFTRGQKYYIRVNFTMAQRCNKLNLNITGIISKRAVPFPVDDQELCKNCIKNLDSSDKCLLKKGSSYLFEYSMDVLKSFPPIALPVSFQVKCNEDKSVFCFMFPVRLV